MINYRQDLEQALEASRDFEAKLDALRVFTKSRTKNLQTRDEAGEIPLLSLFEELTSLAEAVLGGSLKVVKEEMANKYPLPTGAFAIVAMGKFGGRELTYRSDLDLIYLFENPEDREFYTRLGERILTALSVVTREGYAYKIDTELRPSGRGGTLVSTLQAFREYHREMGRTWERQALIRARPFLGDPPFLEETLKVCQSICYQDYDPSRIASEIHLLRMRMEKELARERPGHYNLKTGRGGIVDIEFLVQHLQLVHGRAREEIRTPNTVDALTALKKSGLIEAETADRLREAYLFYREIETRLRLRLDRSADELVEGTEWETLLPRLLKTREEVRAIYEGVFCR